MKLPVASVLLLCLLAAPPAPAQVLVAPLVEARGAERPVQLRSAGIDVELAGSQARTTIELVLHNPNGRDLEGQLSFPLREGQEVSGFALDIDGQLREAVPVPEERGREVFESIVRERVDPALLERTEGNHFRLRVYPIPAGGQRRVRIDLVEALVRRDGQYQLRLDLGFARGADPVTLTVRGAPPVTGPAAGLDFRPTPLGFTAQLGAGHLASQDGLVLHWPAGESGAVQVQTFEGERYFHAELAVAETRTPRRLPGRIGLLWDASGSARQRDIGLDFLLLDRYFAAVGNAEVRLQVLRDRASPARSFKVVAGDWSGLKAALRELPYDGATDLSAWTPEPAVQEYLLFSDGLANYGGQPVPALGGRQRLFAVNSAGARADAGRLRALAEARGGRLVEVAAMSELPAALDALLQDSPRIVAIDAAGAREVVAASPFPVDGLIRLAGRLTAAQGHVEVTLEQAGRLHRVRLALRDGRAREGRFLAQTWAGYRLRELQAEPTLHRTKIRELGQRYGLATAETSLIVLESLDDYVRHDIVPPAPLRDAFLALRGKLATDADQARREHLDRMAAEFAERRAWWDTDFRARAAKAQIASATVAQPTMASGAAERREMAPPRPDPSPSDAAAAPMAAASDESTSLDTVEVTGSRIEDADATGGGGDAGEPRQAVIRLMPWQPDSDFARRLRAAPAGQVYALYLDEREAHLDSSAFYLDVADILLEKGQRELGLRVLSNLAELQLENRHLLRVLGYRLMQAGAAEQAVPVFERVLAISAEEPQSHRDLGLALAAVGRTQPAIEALYAVVARSWDDRFGGIGLIALAEMNAVIARHAGPLDTRSMDPRLLQNLPMAVRAVLTWDSDNSDMDLWVTQPDGERCGYSNQQTAAGGRISEDFTGGYGPEEYAIRRTEPGRYRIEVDHFSDQQQVVAGATTVQLWLSTGFGTAGQKDELVTVRLTPEGDNVLVGEFEVR